MVHWNIVKRNKYKNIAGFTVIECVIAVGILALVCGAVFKAFGVAAKINTSVYEKDKANIIAVDALEDIKKDTVKFLQDNKDKEMIQYYDYDGNIAAKEDADHIIKSTEVVQYYDSKWNKVNKKNATYEIKSNVSGDTRTVNLNGLEPETSMKDRKYYVTFMGKYLGVLVKNWLYENEEESKDSGETPYLFYVIYYYNEEEFKNDWNKIDGMKRGFKDYLSSGSKSDDYSYKSDKELYDFLIQVRDTKAGKYTTEGGKRSDCNVYRVYESKGAVSVRIDFAKNSDKNKYTIDAYNMADKPLNLYMVHSEGNNSMLNVNANGGYVNETEMDIDKNIDKTLYNINIEVNQIKNRTSLIKKQTQKYIRYDNPIH